MSGNGRPVVLTGKQRRRLRALGHHLKPVVMVGKEGVSDAVVGAVEQAIEAHELIKLKVLESAPESVSSTAVVLAERSGAALVQVLGRTVLLYRPDESSPRIILSE